MATNWGNYRGKSHSNSLWNSSGTSSHPAIQNLIYSLTTLLPCCEDYHPPGSQFPGSASTHVRDARLTLLDSMIPGLFKNAKTILDIGCNAGNVSCQLGK